MTALFPFQQADVHRIVTEMAGRCLLASQPGTGKTAVTIAVMRELKVHSAVIVVPRTAMYSWVAEFEKWWPDCPLKISVAKSTGKVPADADITVMSYGVALRAWGLIRGRNPDMLVFDEAHYLKSHDAQRTRKLIPIARAARYLMLLTGTPIDTRVTELYSLLVALRSPLVENLSYFQFAHRFTHARQVEVGGRDRARRLIWTFDGMKEPETLQTELSKVMVRRLKADVLKELPDRTVMPVFMDISPDGSCRGMGAREVSQQEIFDAYRAVGLLKIPQVCEVVADIATADTPVLVFAHHLQVIASIQQALQAHGLRVVALTGNRTSIQRQQAVDQFNSGDAEVFVLSIQAGGVNLTLTRAADVVFAELPWGPATLDQAIDRSHRVGQTRGVVARCLIGKGTVDEVIWRMIKRKRRVAERVVDGDAADLIPMTNIELFRVELESWLQSEPGASRERSGCAALGAA